MIFLSEKQKRNLLSFFKIIVFSPPFFFFDSSYQIPPFTSFRVYVPSISSKSIFTIAE